MEMGEKMAIARMIGCRKNARISKPWKNNLKLLSKISYVFIWERMNTCF